MRICNSCQTEKSLDNIIIDNVLDNESIIVKCKECGDKKVVRLKVGYSLSELLTEYECCGEKQVVTERSAESRYILLYHNRSNSCIMEIGDSLAELKKHAREYKPNFVETEIKEAIYFVNPSDSAELLKIESMYIR